MSLLFWRKTHDVAPQEAESVAVSEINPLPVAVYTPDTEPLPRFEIDQSVLPRVEGETRDCLVEVPGIATASAYTAADAFGTKIIFHDVFRPGKNSGTIVGAFFIDKDDEGLQKDLVLFARDFTHTADHDEFAISDQDLTSMRAGISITTYFNFANNQFGQAWNTGIWIKADGPDLYAQIVTQGADNIAAGSIPLIGIVVIPD